MHARMSAVLQPARTVPNVLSLRSCFAAGQQRHLFLKPGTFSRPPSRQGCWGLRDTDVHKELQQVFSEHHHELEGGIDQPIYGAEHYVHLLNDAGLSLEDIQEGACMAYHRIAELFVHPETDFNDCLDLGKSKKNLFFFEDDQ
eukprot:INCI1891.1.p1 GENE.INCI1891.1~~INCI1891.1.p1  ORF type:complete len:143 (+),score=20.85 INCI1891.1:135-563(+)